MEEKINVAEILKDKPQGTKLYDWLYNIDVESDTISTTDTETVVWCINETDNNTTCHRGYSEFGTVRGCSDGLRILLPSKEMRDWSKFAWKKGDVLVCGVDNLCIFEKWDNEDYTEFKAIFATPNYSGATFKTEKWSKETNEAVIKQYISNIEKFKGGKLNLATLEIEKQPEFKDGDIVIFKSDVIVLVKRISFSKKVYFHAYMSNGDAYIQATEHEFYGYIYEIKGLATDSEKQQLFEALKKEGKAWDEEKKKIVDLPKKCEFKPFDKVLVRDCNHKWKAGFFSHYSEGLICPFICVGGCYEYCIPYNEETAHLLGTTDEWER